MAIVSIYMKSPDCIGDAIDEAAKAEVDAIEGITEEEREGLLDGRRSKISDACSKWIEYGEYIAIEIDTDAGTATVKEQ